MFWTIFDRTDVKISLLSSFVRAGNDVSEKLAPPKPPEWMDGRTGGCSRPSGSPPIASAFGDTDGEIFGRKIFRLKSFLAEIFRPKLFSAQILFSQKKCWTHLFFGPKIFWLKISPSVSPKAEAMGGGLGVAGVREPPSVRPSVRRSQDYYRI